MIGIFRCSIPGDKVINLSSEHSEYKWAELAELSEVQRIRAIGAIEYKGHIISADAL